MEDEVKRRYIEAGEAVQKARKKAREVTEPGKNLKQIAEEVEAMIRNEGLEPAFPVNLSLNDAAAHYTPSRGEERKVESSDVVKIDIGAHSDGYIADTALTVNSDGDYGEMIEANREVLEKALEFIEPGVTVGELGTYIQNQVPEKYSVVRNLTGHSLGKYSQHAGLSIPNISNADNTVLEEGDAVAIEPFLTTGAGKIKEGKKGNIYIHRNGNPRGKTGRKLLKRIKEFKGLPFTSRWLDLDARRKMALKKLVQSGAVKHYPVLRELDGGTVTQAEHTVLVGVDEGENIVTTR
ncbi:MAG: type II methionyl aminopeptidase [Candidatus Nanohalobium sp.]